MNTEINKYTTTEELFKKAAERIIKIITDCVDKDGKCSFVLAGGNTPKQLYDLIVKDYSGSVDWDKVYFFWGDERCVPPDREDSNYVMAYYHLLSGLNVNYRNVFRIKGEEPPGIGAQLYDTLIKSFFNNAFPSFDLFLLGVGRDGHTASLFPNSKILNETSKFVEADYYEKHESWRITLTLPIINEAKNVIFIAEGSSKAEIIKEIFNNENLNLPAQLVKPVNGKLSWFIDKEAGIYI